VTSRTATSSRSSTSGSGRSSRSSQLREATPFDERPRFLIRDNDRKYGLCFDRLAAASGIRVLRTPVRAPRANATCERFLGSVRRECLNHRLIVGECHLRSVLKEYAAYFNRARPHQGLGQRVLQPRLTPPPAECGGTVLAIPILGGLHHHYQRAA
jgi:putative transposase